MNLPKKKVYKNGAILIYKHRNRKCTSVNAGFVFGKNRDYYPEPIAHFCEHMFFIETETKTKEQLKKEMLNTFSMNNGRTHIYYTIIDFCRSNKVVEDCFKLSSDMLLNTKFQTKYINSEKGVIQQELVRRLNSPETISHYTFLRTISNKSIKNSLVLGNKEEIEKVTAKELKKFRDQIFISQNFVITIEGGISFYKAKRLAEKYFIKNLKSNPDFPVDKTYNLPWDKHGNLTVENYSFNKSICKITIKLPPELESSDINSVSAAMLCRLCNGLTGKLLGNLREHGLVYSAGINFDDTPTQNCLMINFSCSSDNINKVIDQLGNILAELRTKPFDAELIEKDKTNSKLFKDENIAKIYPSTLFASYLKYGNNIFSKTLTKRKKKIFEKLTSNDILEFCKNALTHPENIYVSILTDIKSDKIYLYEEIQKILTTNIKRKH